MELGARQKRQTRRETDRDSKKRDRQRLRELRTELRAARARRKARMREISAGCRAARQQITIRANRARARLRESIKRTRARARELCSTTRGKEEAAALEQIAKAHEALEVERAHQNTLAVWTRPNTSKGPRKGARARERASESDDAVEANIDDPGLRVVWSHVKAKIKGNARRSRTEAFFEWAAEHAAQVYEIQERDAERVIAELERQEAALSKALRKRGPYKSPAGCGTPACQHSELEAVPF